MSTAFTLAYDDRIDDVLEELRTTWGVHDREAALLLLASRLKAPGRPPWLVVETEFFGIAPRESWPAFGGMETISFANVNQVRPRLREQLLNHVLATRDATPRTFIEPCFHAPYPRCMASSRSRAIWDTVQQNLLRLRTDDPKAAPPNWEARARLHRLAERVVDSELREAPAAYPRLPERLHQQLERLQLLNPDLGDWATLYGSVQGLGGRAALLYNRPVEEADWRLVERAVHDSVREWTVKVMLAAGTEPRHFDDIRRDAKLLSRLANVELYPVYNTQMRRKGSGVLSEGQFIGMELKRLVRAGLMGSSRARFWVKDAVAWGIVSRAV